MYYPDLSTPAFRDLQLAVTDGRSFTDRETDPGVRSRVEAVPGSLTFRQTTSTRRWRMTKTWITDPARATVLAQMRLRLAHRASAEALRAGRSRRPGDDGNDDRGRSPARAPAGLGRRRGRQRRGRPPRP